MILPPEISQNRTAAKGGVQTRSGPQDVPPQPQCAHALDELFSTHPPHIRHHNHHLASGEMRLAMRGEEKRTEQNRTEKKGVEKRTWCKLGTVVVITIHRRRHHHHLALWGR